MTKRSDDSEQDKPAPLEYDEAYFHEGQEFLSTARKYISRGRAQHDWVETQHLQLRLAQVIVESADTLDWLKVLKRMIRAYDSPPSLEERRWHAVEAIRRCGEAWWHPDWQASEQTRRTCVRNLVNALEPEDEDFAALNDEFDFIAPLVDTYSPHQARGKKTAERILADMIVYLGGALGFTVDSSADSEDEAERVRRLLTRKVGDFLKSIDSA
jgi:tRNA(Ile)-lysidine synthase TilS/MesJ